MNSFNIFDSMWTESWSSWLGDPKEFNSSYNGCGQFDVNTFPTCRNKKWGSWGILSLVWSFPFAVCAYLAIHYCDKLLLIAYILHTLILNCEICAFFFFFQTLLCFFEADHIEMWNPVAPIASFWEIRLEKT